ncbi:MAG: hypothetical protein V1806_00275 [Pseudomonadota bacterium]
MNPLLPVEMEKTLSGAWSHLIFRSAGSDLRVRLCDYLGRKGVAIKKELVFQGMDGQPWLLVSLARADAGPLIMELIEQGFPQNIIGIDAKPGAGKVC